ncbi:MAG: presqualene diphosphate synthase HpnD [Dehalococcoidia bacterium]
MEDSLQEAYRYCQELAKREAKNFYYGFILLPLAKRQAIYAGYAFARRCDDIVDDVLEPEEKVKRLAEYRHCLEQCLQGRPSSPIFLALQDTIRRYRIPPEYFWQLIDGVEMDLTVRRYPTFADLRRYCYGVASTVGLICIEIFGHRNGQQARQHAEDLGIALQLTNILRDIREDAERDRIYIPQDEMQRFGVGEADIFSGTANEPFLHLIRFQAERAREYHRRGRELLPLLSRRSRACTAVLQGIYSRILERIEAEPFAVLRERVSLSASQKLALAGRELVRSLMT